MWVVGCSGWSAISTCQRKQNGRRSGRSRGAAFLCDGHPARRNELRLAETLTASSNAPELVRLFSQATERGFNGIQIDHYGRLPDTTLTALRQAVRFARRTVGEDASPA